VEDAAQNRPAPVTDNSASLKGSGHYSRGRRPRNQTRRIDFAL